jgi:hypothetical protein
MDEPDRDPVVEAYKAGVDRTLLRENLKLSPEERLRKAMAHMKFAETLRTAGRQLRAEDRQRKTGSE